MEKQKCYIAGKITGLPEDVYSYAFQVAEKEVSALGFEPVNPVVLPHNHGKAWNDYMKEALVAMLSCSHVYALTNWRYSHGATIEVNLALSVGINIIHQQPEPF